eukprot:TRINITY_DN314_c0_g1_i1.p1 TRINITY_DN314_c0_g1~~TRINITY_DN314_c0_g1_i1.p1  ORF type:complete len:134 (-),score=12.77 TRINITY_DN314_c0_g1_i1:48-449(-)
MMMEESSSPNVKVIIILSGALAVGLLCNILSCVLWKNWLPFLVIVAYVLAPIPNLVCARCGHDPLDASGRNFKDMGYFLTGFLVISGFGIPAVMAHSQVIRYEALLLALAGGLIVYATILIYLHMFHKKHEDF